jgi:hypothetical protein
MNQFNNQEKGKSRVGIFKKSRAVICHYCPFCMYARKRQDSFVGKILHHPNHADNCPMWNAEKEVYQRRDSSV